MTSEDRITIRLRAFKKLPLNPDKLTVEELKTFFSTPGNVVDLSLAIPSSSDGTIHIKSLLGSFSQLEGSGYDGVNFNSITLDKKKEPTILLRN